VSTNNVVVILSHLRLKAGGVARRLNPANETRLHQHGQVVVNSLRGERAELLAYRIGDRLHIQVLALALYRGEHGQPRPGNPKARRAKLLEECEFVRHTVCPLDHSSLTFGSSIAIDLE
jgi:hypothetical protein